MDKVAVANAAGLGLFNGVFRVDPRAGRKCPEKYEDNIGIFKLGYTVGYLLKIALIIAFGPEIAAL